MALFSRDATTSTKQERPGMTASNDTQKLRIGFIGTGGIARTHMRYLHEMDEVDIVAGADINADNLAQVKDQYDVDGLYEDWTEMLANEDLVAVDICTPNSLHYQPTLDALNADCHVMVEKPLAMNADEGQQMLDAAADKGKHLIIGFQHRYRAPVQMLKSMQADGEFGDIMFMKCRALRRRGIPNWGVFGRKELQGGGPMIDIGVHCMEMAHYVMGRPEPVAASGNTWTYMGNKASDTACRWAGWDYETYTVEDLAIGQIRFDNGAIMQVEASFAAHCEDKFDFTFMGTEGGATLDGPTIYQDRHGHMVHTKPDWMPETDPFKQKMCDFVDTLLGKQKSSSPAADGQMIQRMIDGIYKSAEEGKEVPI